MVVSRVYSAHTKATFYRFLCFTWEIVRGVFIRVSQIGQSQMMSLPIETIHEGIFQAIFYQIFKNSSSKKLKRAKTQAKFCKKTQDIRTFPKFL